MMKKALKINLKIFNCICIDFIDQADEKQSEQQNPTTELPITLFYLKPNPQPTNSPSDAAAEDDGSDGDLEDGEDGPDSEAAAEPVYVDFVRPRLPFEVTKNTNQVEEVEDRSAKRRKKVEKRPLNTSWRGLGHLPWDADVVARGCSQHCT